MVKTINFPCILTVFPTYFLANVIISVIKEKTIISLKRKKYKETRKDLVPGVDHTQHVKTRKLSQPSKKLNCPVQFSVKKLCRFPEYKISKDTSWQRSSTSKKIKLVLQQLSIKKATTVDKFQVIWNMSQSFQKVIILLIFLFMIYLFISVSFITVVYK